MRKLVRQLALALALLLTVAGVVTAAAEDWRSQLRALYGLTVDYDGGDIAQQPTPQATAKPKKKDKKQATAKPTEAPRDVKTESARFELPVTDPQQIVNYLALYGELPENFITKNEARDLGWDSRYNYVGEVAPGKSIGGDRFGNYEGQLPEKKGRKWFECDANYGGRRRGAERVLYSSDGLYYYTDDHYETFTQLFPEDLP